MRTLYYRFISLIRWKLYKLGMLFSLGRTWGWGIDRNLVYYIPEACVSEDVRSHVVEIREISDAYVQRYRFPIAQGKAPFSGTTAFARAKPVAVRNLYHLSDVAVSVDTGAMWVPGKCAFVESLGNNIHFYAWGGLKDMMRKPLNTSAGIVTPCANLGYYHWLLDAMGQVLIARREFGRKVKILVSNHPFGFVREGLRFFGIDDCDIIPVDGPVVAENAIMVARNSDLGVIFKDNIDVLRKEISRHWVRSSAPSRKIYISRRLEQNRAIRNEEEIENIAREAGFEVCYFERMTFANQMKAASEASVIAGIHGAGLSNIIAGRDGLKVIELLNPAWFNPCFAQLASQLGFEYHCAVLKQANSEVYADISEVGNLLSMAVDCKGAANV